MKRLLTLILCTFIFVGCNKVGDNMDRAIAFRQTLLQQNGCRFTCDLTADYGNILYSFSLECEADKEGTIAFTVSSPESISGITGVISATGGKITFDNSVLGFPILSENLPTPLGGPWIFMTALRSGYIRTSDDVGGKLSLTIADTYEEDAILMLIDFDEEDVPVYCELIWQGRRILSMEIKSFTYL